MRKKLIVALTLLALATASLIGYASEPALIPITFTDFPTNATGVVTSTVPLSGWLYSIELNQKVAGTTCTVTFVTATNVVGDVETTLLSISGFVSSGEYRPRFPVHLPADGSVVGTNDLSMLMFVQQGIKATASLANTSNLNIGVKIKLVD